MAQQDSTDGSWKEETNMLLEKLTSSLSTKQQELVAREQQNISENESIRRREKELEEQHETTFQEMTMSINELRLCYERKLAVLEDEKKFMKNIYQFQSEKIKIDVGGNVFSTSRSTLCKVQDSMLAAMFSGRHKLIKAEDGSFFIDRDGTYFRYILNFLRGHVIESKDLPNDKRILRELRLEADFYQLKSFIKLIDEVIVDESVGNNDYSQDDINKILSTVVRTEKNPTFNLTNSRFFNNGISELAHATLLKQNVQPGESLSERSKFIIQNMTKCKLDFTGKNLSGISFSHTTFNHNATFRECNLSGATFYGCEFGIGITIDFTYSDLRDTDFRNCKGKEAGPKMSFGPNTFEFGNGGLVSGASSDIFVQMVQEKRIIYRGTRIDGAKFDPNVYAAVKNCTI